VSRSIIRQCLTYLLILLLPLQAAAAGRLALCATLTETTQLNNTAMAEHCAQMDSMPRSDTADIQSSDPNDNHQPHNNQPHNSGCWLGSICLAGLGAAALPTAYTTSRIDRITPVPLPHFTYYHSIIAAVPQRPPAIF
jgi:hypothetical protein